MATLWAIPSNDDALLHVLWLPVDGAGLRVLTERQTLNPPECQVGSFLLILMDFDCRAPVCRGASAAIPRRLASVCGLGGIGGVLAPMLLFGSRFHQTHVIRSSSRFLHR